MELDTGMSGDGPDHDCRVLDEPLAIPGASAHQHTALGDES